MESHLSRPLMVKLMMTEGRTTQSVIAQTAARAGADVPADMATVPEATKKIKAEVSTGTSLTLAMQNANVFPSMVIQMCSIGEETGALDGMLGKVADFFEAEVDDAVEALSSLMEPMIMVVLGTLIGGMVIAMYLPIFKIGQAV